MEAPTEHKLLLFSRMCMSSFTSLWQNYKSNRRLHLICKTLQTLPLLHLLKNEAVKGGCRTSEAQAFVSGSSPYVPVP